MNLPTASEIKKGLLELMLIFVGISLALGFENLISDMQRRDQELSLLNELLLDIEETENDLLGDLDAAERRLNTTESLIRWFDGEDEELANSPRGFSGISNICTQQGALFPKASAYESIKSIGLDLISNDEIRSAVSSFYELSINRVRSREAQFIQRSETSCVPLINKEFKIIGKIEIIENELQSYVIPGQRTTRRRVRSEGIAPIDADALRQNHVALNGILELHRVSSNLLNTYEQVAGEIEVLKRLIEIELAN